MVDQQKIIKKLDVKEHFSNCIRVERPKINWRVYSYPLYLIFVFFVNLCYYSNTMRKLHEFLIKIFIIEFIIIQNYISIGMQNTHSKADVTR